MRLKNVCLCLLTESTFKSGLSLLILAGLLLISCHNDLPVPTGFKEPSFSNLSVSNITGSSAVLSCILSGDLTSATTGFQLWENGSETKDELTASIQEGKMSVNLTDLKPETQYSFRAFVRYGSSMTLFSESSSFKTLSASGLVEFSDIFVDQITSGSARFSVTVSSKVQVDSVSFVYGLDGFGENLKINAAKDGNLFTAQSSDLVERSDYSVTAIAVDDQGNRYQSSSASFRTLGAQSPFQTIDLSELDAHQATISVTLKEDVSIKKCWFLLKDKTSQTSLQTEVSRDGQSPLVMT